MGNYEYYRLDQETLKKLADEGDADAMERLAWKYQGSGNYEKEIEYLKKAAEKGQSEAECRLGVYYIDSYQGIIPRNIDEAERWLKKSSEHGNCEAKWQLAELYYRLGENRKALLWYENAYQDDMTFDYSPDLNAWEYIELTDKLKEAIAKEDEEKRQQRNKILRDPTFDIIGIAASAPLYFLIGLYVSSGSGSVDGFFGLLKTAVSVVGIFVAGIASFSLLLESISPGLDGFGKFLGFAGAVLIITLSKNYPAVPGYARLYAIGAAAILIVSMIYKQIKYR